MLQAHINHVDGAIGLLAGHPSDIEAVSFLDVPGFEGPVSYMSLIGPCASASSYDEYCDPETLLCSHIECTGVAAGWIVHTRTQAARSEGDFAFASITGEVAWEDGSTGFSWRVSSEATGRDGQDWSITGEGAVVPEGASWAWSLDESLPSLSSAGAAQLGVTHGIAGGSGTLVIGGVTVATIDDALAVTETGECP